MELNFRSPADLRITRVLMVEDNAYYPCVEGEGSPSSTTACRSPLPGRGSGHRGGAASIGLAVSLISL